MTQRRRELLAVLSLIAVTLIWGTTFVLVKRAIEHIPPFEFLAIRFAAAAILLAALFPRSLRTKQSGRSKAGLLAGIALAAGYGFQTFGLRYTGATKAGFITGLFVVFTPLLGAAFLRRSPSWVAVAGVFVATAGLFLLTGGTKGHLNYGDLLVLGCAISFSFHVIALGKYSPSLDPRSFTVFQLAVCAVIFTLGALISGGIFLPRDRIVWFALALCALGASALAFLVQTWAQKLLSPTRTAITLAMEPVFAGMAGFIFLSERLPVLGWVGAAMILAAMLLVDLRPMSPGEL